MGALGREARKPGELCLIFVSDREIRRVNRRFLNHDYATDVIAFRYEDHARVLGEDAPFGDIYVARGVARRQAREQGHSLLEELLTLSVHGALHLAGYDDKTPAARRRMFARQDRLVRRFLKAGL